MPAPTPSYTFTTIDAPGATETTPQAINDRGDSSGEHGLYHDHGTINTLNVSGASFTEAAAINDRGGGRESDHGATQALLHVNGTSLGAGSG